MSTVHKYFLLLSFFLSGSFTWCQSVNLLQGRLSTSPITKPWVVWYWLHGAISKEGITADLEAMKEVGIGGAYLMTIKDTNSKIPYQPQVRQLSPQWRALIKHALMEAHRLHIEIGVHISDGFALAGGPWVTPQMSMQKLVWTKTYLPKGATHIPQLPLPKANQNYYKDIAVFAYPANYSNQISLQKLAPVVTTSTDSVATFLADESQSKTFRSDTDCWIQYTYPYAVTIRQVRIRKQSNPYQSQRFIIQQSDDGIRFTPVDTLQPPRQGWQDWDEGYTHAVKTFQSKYIRFVWLREGTQPGSEDLDAAKWKAVLKVQGIYVSDEPVVHNIEAKNGSMWRVAAATTVNEVTNMDAVPVSKIINISNRMLPNGQLKWKPPAHTSWVIVRIGHTSTGYMNNTGGGGKGLETDKFSTAAATMQFNKWFNEIYNSVDTSVAKQTIKVFHMDSWECGSQNWSEQFLAEFKRRRGYNLLPYLVVMTGTPINNAATSEKILHDVRRTITELVTDNFYGTLKKLAHEKGCQFSAESIAPTFTSDGLLHFKQVDIPMGEFWVKSPTHDKPNDMFDAISAGHIYGEKIIGAEAFTTLRMDWSEHPGSLKAVGDLAFAEGVNKLAIHVFMQSPWLAKKPGISLDGIGMFYQRGQTWFKQSSAWIDYITRCQNLLQAGKPVVDIGVFIGEDIPSRSILPDRLVNILPGIFGKQKVEQERLRLKNEGQPMQEMPQGVSSSANTYNPRHFIDALHGYKYDCFNRDVLMGMYVKNGVVYTAYGAAYNILIFPGIHPMNPDGFLSPVVRNKIVQLKLAGAKIITSDNPLLTSGGFIKAPFFDTSFKSIGVEKDVQIMNSNDTIAWAHRQAGDTNIYFISNQMDRAVEPHISFRINGYVAEIYDAVTGQLYEARVGAYLNNRTEVGIRLEPYQSCFVVFKKRIVNKKFLDNDFTCKGLYQVLTLDSGWQVSFDRENGEGESTYNFERLESWSRHKDDFVKYYSGTATYSTKWVWKDNDVNGIYLKMDSLWNVATVKVNGMDFGTLWTAPYILNISKAVKQGENTIEIQVTNTWRNRMIGEQWLPVEKRTLWVNDPYGVRTKPLLPAGIKGVELQY